MAAPVYVSQQPAVEMRPGAGLEPQPLPQLPGGEAARAAGQFGEAVNEFAVKVQHAQTVTKVAGATTDYLVGLDKLKTKYEQDTDFATAPQRFEEDRLKLEGDIIGKAGLDTRTEATLRQHFVRTTISAAGNVRKAALAREADTNLANLDTQETQNIRDAAAAGSSEERGVVVDRYKKSLADAAAAGWITNDAAVKRAQRFAATIDDVDVMRIIRTDPDQAAKLLADPNNFRNLGPEKRETFLTHAQAAADERNTATLINKARFKPEIASLELGRVIAPEHADKIFEGGMVPTESGGKNLPPNEKGAMGPAQIQVGTARDMLKAAGREDLAKLDDAELTAKLMENPDMSQALGKMYFRAQLKRYEGNVPLALAAYNAGPARADEWKAAAEAKFGTNYSAAQLASVIDYKETRDYIGKVYAKVGANPAGAGISAGGGFRAATQLGSELQHQETAQNQAASSLASAARSTEDIVDLLKGGYAVDPERIATYRQTQATAAARGDMHAAGELRRVDEAIGMAPYVRQAYSMPPAALETVTNQMETALRQSTNVTIDQVRKLKAFHAVRDEVTKQANDDPVTLGARAGLYRDLPIDPKASASDPTFLRGLAATGTNAITAADWYSVPVKPFNKQTEAALKTRYENAGPGERFDLITALARAMPERAYKAALEQIGGGDEMTVTAGLIARDGRPELARQILEGAAVLKTPDLDKKKTDVREALRQKLGGELYPDPAMQTAVIHAALAVYAAKRGNNGTLYDPTDGSELEKAIETVTGPLTKRGGLKVAAPPAMQASTFGTVLDKLTADDIKSQGGAYDRIGRPIEPAELGRRAQLRQLGPGAAQYVVTMPTADGRGAPVLNLDGRPLVLDMKDLARRYATRRDEASATRPPRRDSVSAAVGKMGTEGTAPAIWAGEPPAPPPAPPAEENWRDLHRRVQAGPGGVGNFIDPYFSGGTK